MDFRRTHGVLDYCVVICHFGGVHRSCKSPDEATGVSDGSRRHGQAQTDQELGCWLRRRSNFSMKANWADRLGRRVLRRNFGSAATRAREPKEKRTVRPSLGSNQTPSNQGPWMHRLKHLERGWRRCRVLCERRAIARGGGFLARSPKLLIKVSASRRKRKKQLSHLLLLSKDACDLEVVYSLEHGALGGRRGVSWEDRGPRNSRDNARA